MNELPELPTGMFLRREDMQKEIVATLLDFTMMDDKFREGRKKPVFTIRTSDGDYRIDVSNSNVNDIRRLFGTEWKGQEVLITKKKIEVDDRKGFVLEFSKLGTD